ncbi:MAG: alpha/beta hydrolase [Selenomonadaceae bacterium]|nr:alpha/beta hydrolase [Selenomonadaceae bacterium]
MKKKMIYIHGKNGTAAEAKHYEPLFPGFDVIGFDYKSETPWEAQEEFRPFLASLNAEYNDVAVIANSIGAFFTMCALGDKQMEKAYFISPIVNMERLIADMMKWSGVSESELKDKGTIATSFGEVLSWEYLSWVRKHPISWNTPTVILYGAGDKMQSFDTIRLFADKTKAVVTVMENGEHWFHTESQLAFLDKWLQNSIFQRMR